MSTQEQQKPKTEKTELIGIAVLVIIVLIITLLFFLVLRPKLFSGSTYKPPGPASTNVICPTSSAPIGLVGEVNDISEPNFEASWNPVLIAFSTGQTVIGYHIFVSTSPGITKENTSSSYTPIPQVRVENAAGAKLEFGKTYYFRVATLDTCGLGDVSTEEISITI
jgi:hypothetical protein